MSPPSAPSTMGAVEGARQASAPVMTSSFAAAHRATPPPPSRQPNLRKHHQICYPPLALHQARASIRQQSHPAACCQFRVDHEHASLETAIGDIAQLRLSKTPGARAIRRRRV
jgi:hypothetical protein